MPVLGHAVSFHTFVLFAVDEIFRDLPARAADATVAEAPAVGGGDEATTGDAGATTTTVSVAHCSVVVLMMLIELFYMVAIFNALGIIEGSCLEVHAA